MDLVQEEAAALCSWEDHRDTWEQGRSRALQAGWGERAALGTRAQLPEPRSTGYGLRCFITPLNP